MLVPLFIARCIAGAFASSSLELCPKEKIVNMVDEDYYY